MAVISINSFTGKVIEEIPETQVSLLPSLVQNARSASVQWKALEVGKRVGIVNKLIPLLEQNKESLAKIVHEEMGKPFNQALTEVDRAIEVIQYFAETVPKAVEEEVISNTEKETNILTVDPLGVVACITPWNAPVQTPIVSILPALLTGNTVLFKPSEHTTLTGIALFRLFEQLHKEGLPKNALQLVIGGKDVGKALVNQNIDHVCFTGSLRAGKQIMKDSSEQLHRITFELGGKDPAIVLKDCDLDATAVGIVKGATRNTGQVCCGVERVYIEKDIFDAFTQKVVEHAQNVSVDEGNNPEADIGPLVREFQRKMVEDHVADAKEKGARFLVGGETPHGPGYFYPVSVVTNVNHSMKLMTEETFGPIIPLMAVDTIEQALEYANNSNYGLTASVWTKNASLAADLAGKLVAGTVTINRYGSSKIGCPWGGAKQSGIGRLYTKEGIREFCNIKHVWVNKV